MRKKKPKNLVYLNAPTLLDLPIERVLENALDSDLKEVIVLGIKDDERYYATHTSDIALIILRLEQAKRYYLDRLEE